MKVLNVWAMSKEDNTRLHFKHVENVWVGRHSVIELYGYGDFSYKPPFRTLDPKDWDVLISVVSTFFDTA